MKSHSSSSSPATAQPVASLLTLLPMIAAALPGKWVAGDRLYPHHEVDPKQGTLIREDGLILWAFLGGYGNEGRISISLSRPRDKGASGGGHVDVWEGSNRLADPRITVADTKSDRQIAADIARRLLPEAERVFGLVMERINAANAHRGVRANTAARIAEALGKAPDVRSPDADPTFNLDVTGAHLRATGYGDVRVNGESVDFKLSSIPTDKAVALAAWLRANIFTG